MLGDMEGLHKVLGDACESKNNPRDCDLDQKSDPANSAKGVPSLACPGLEQVVLPQHSLELPDPGNPVCDLNVMMM